MYEIIAQAGIHSIIVVATVEAVRKRVDFDGWSVLVVAACVSLALSALFLPAASLAELLEGLRVSVLAWLIAVGGDAWVAKVSKLLAQRSGFLLEESSTPEEAPTRKDIKTL